MRFFFRDGLPPWQSQCSSFSCELPSPLFLEEGSDNAPPRPRRLSILDVIPSLPLCISRLRPLLFLPLNKVLVSQSRATRLSDLFFLLRFPVGWETFPFPLSRPFIPSFFLEFPGSGPRAIFWVLSPSRMRVKSFSEVKSFSHSRTGLYSVRITPAARTCTGRRSSVASLSPLPFFCTTSP